MRQTREMLVPKVKEKKVDSINSRSASFNVSRTSRTPDLVLYQHQEAHAFDANRCWRSKDTTAATLNSSDHTFTYLQKNRPCGHIHILETAAVTFLTIVRRVCASIAVSCLIFDCHGAPTFTKKSFMAGVIFSVRASFIRFAKRRTYARWVAEITRWAVDFSTMERCIYLGTTFLGNAAKGTGTRTLSHFER